MKKPKTPKEFLEHFIKHRDENILLLSKRTDEDLKELSDFFYKAKEDAYYKNDFEAYKLDEEKLSQVSAAQDLKFSFTEEASDWIHW
jgi:hypothetical protein